MQQDQGATANLSSHFQDLRTFTSTEFLIRGMHFPQLSCNKSMNKSRSSLPTNFGTHLFRTLTAATQVHTTYAVLAASVHYCLSPLLFEPFPMVKWRKRIGEGSYRHILNTSHQLQMKIVLGIPSNNLCMVISYVHTSIHLPAICVSVMHSTFRVDQYMALFYLYYTLHGLHGNVQGYVVWRFSSLFRCFGWFLFRE